MLVSISKHKWIIRALIPSIYFCFRKLPFRQAIKLPLYWCINLSLLIFQGCSQLMHRLDLA